MAAETNCPYCQAERPANAPGGLCPRCLLRLGLGESLSMGSSEEDESGLADRRPAHSGEARSPISRSAGPMPPSGVLTVLKESIGPVPRILLREGSIDDPRPVRPGSEEMPDPTEAPCRYQLLGEIARGGIGAILKGRDMDLGRDLAVKVLLEKHRDHPEMVRRFVEEAQIGGQLQHPGIVPVHELGRFPDGRLYIAMKLVRGHTLAALLESRSSPAEDRPRFVAIFDQVCQTMAYAHSRGVVHRDLKPSNIMVGSFGEVQVMDWGLAKVLDQGGVADEEKSRRRAVDLSAVKTLRTGSQAGESRAGSVLGTPAYMAPEQARGALDTLDERADVFSLGSILCEILTGEPAFRGQTGLELCRKAERADTADALARLEACGADGDLIALGKSCLAAAAKDRPRDAGVVLAGLTAHLTGVGERLRAAELAQAKAEARAAGERKRRVLTLALAASVFATGLLGAGGWYWAAWKRADREEATSLEVNRAIDEANRKRNRARLADGDASTRWIEAVEAARRAESLLARGEGNPELRGRVRSTLESIIHDRDESESTEKDRRIVERLAEIHNDLGEHGDDQRAEAEYAEAFRGYGVDLDRLSPEEAGARLAASPVAVELANALDQWTFIRRGPSLHDGDGAQQLVAVAKLADPDPWRNRLRDTLARRSRDRARGLEDLEQLADTADLNRLPEASVTRLAFALAMRGRRDRAITMLRRTQRLHPDDFWVNADLGRELMFSGKPDQAVRFFAVAMGIRPKSDIALRSLGSALHLSGQLEDAAEVLRQGIGRRPDDAQAHAVLGSLLMKMGRRPEAEAEFREAKRLKPEDWRVRDAIAEAWSDRDWDKALAERRDAVGQQPPLPRSHEAHFRKVLGQTLLEVGRNDPAVEAFREAIRLDPRIPHGNVGLARALMAVGELAAARDALDARRGGPPSWEPSPEHVALAAEIRRMMALETRLPSLLRGEDRPADAGESADFARLCSSRQLYATSARLWSEALAARPDDRRSDDRDQAAHAAAMAGAGLGNDATQLDEAARKRWRDQALDWLESERVTLADVVEKGTPQARADVARRLGRWRIDPALAGIRDAAVLDALPEAERRVLRDFWAKVGNLQEQAQARASGDLAQPS